MENGAKEHENKQSYRICFMVQTWRILKLHPFLWFPSRQHITYLLVQQTHSNISIHLEWW